MDYEQIVKYIKDVSDKKVGEAFKFDGDSFYFALILYWKYKDQGAKMIVDRNRNKFACMIRGRLYDVGGEITGRYDWQFYTLY